MINKKSKNKNKNTKNKQPKPGRSYEFPPVREFIDCHIDK